MSKKEVLEGFLLRFRSELINMLNHFDMDVVVIPTLDYYAKELNEYLREFGLDCELKVVLNKDIGICEIIPTDIKSAVIVSGLKAIISDPECVKLFGEV